MARTEEKGRANYSKFDSLDTTVLEAILQADFDAPEAERLEAEEALYVAGLLAERQKKKHKDAETLMAEFFEYYYPGGELYDLDEEPDRDINEREDDIHDKGSDKKVISYVQKGWRRFASAVAVLVLFMSIGTATAYALGYDPIAALINGHAVTEATMELVEQMAGLQEEEIVPKWLPEGYAPESVEQEQIGRQCYVWGNFARARGGGKISINYSSWRDSDGGYSHSTSMNVESIKRLYNIEFSDIAVYSVNGVDYYILGTDKRRTIAWDKNPWSCVVVGSFSADEAVRIVNSIYE